MTDYLFGLYLSPPSSGRAIYQRTIARFFWPEKKKVDLIERTNRAFFFFLSQLELHVTGNEAPACEHAIVNILKISKNQFTRSPNQSRQVDATCHGNSAK